MCVYIYIYMNNISCMSFVFSVSSSKYSAMLYITYRHIVYRRLRRHGMVHVRIKRTQCNCMASGSTDEIKERINSDGGEGKKIRSFLVTCNPFDMKSLS